MSFCDFLRRSPSDQNDFDCSSLTMRDMQHVVKEAQLNERTARKEYMKCRLEALADLIADCRYSPAEAAELLRDEARRIESGYL